MNLRPKGRAQAVASSGVELNAGSAGARPFPSFGTPRKGSSARQQGGARQLIANKKLPAKYTGDDNK